MDAFSPQSFADAMECVAAATPMQITNCSSVCCRSIFLGGMKAIHYAGQADNKSVFDLSKLWLPSVK